MLRGRPATFGACLTITFAGILFSQNSYTISTLAGAASTLDGYSGDGGPATRARLNKPGGLAISPNGELYISDTWNNVIRRIDKDGIIHTVAGTGAQGYAGDNGPASRAKLVFPRGIAFDSQGNLYIADTQNHRIRCVTVEGIITTIAGTGQRGYSGDGGLAREAQLSWPDGIAIDASDVLYFTEPSNNSVRRIGRDGIISTVVGPPSNSARSSPSRLANPRGIAIGSDDAIYVSDASNNRIVKIGHEGVATTFAGTNVLFGYDGTMAPGDGGKAIAAAIPNPMAIAFDSSGNLFVAAAKIRRVDHDGVITTVLGARVDQPATENGDPLTTRLSNPADIVVDKNGDLIVADTYRHRILRLSKAGKVEVIAGLSRFPDEVDGGPAAFTRLGDPWGIATAPNGDVVIADTVMNRILRISSDGHATRVAGKGIPILRMEGSGPPPQFSGDGGPATSADLDGPSGVAIDRQGNIYISDSINNRIRKVSTDGRIQTIAGTGEDGYGGDGGPAVSAKFSQPMGLAVDAAENVYVADRQNNRIRQITPDGIIRTVVGIGAERDSGDGAPLQISLAFPHGVAVDNRGRLYIADTFNHRIRRLDPDGIVRIVAGIGNQEFGGDEGPAINAGLGAPDALSIDVDGNIYIADRANWRIRKITTDGIIHTIAGNKESGYYGDGGPAVDAPIFPTAVAVNARGIVYLTDHNRVRVLTPLER